jgi:hypothetical protein
MSFSSSSAQVNLLMGHLLATSASKSAHRPIKLPTLLVSIRLESGEDLVFLSSIKRNCLRAHCLATHGGDLVFQHHSKRASETRISPGDSSVRRP